MGLYIGRICVLCCMVMVADEFSVFIVWKIKEFVPYGGTDNGDTVCWLNVYICT